MWKWISTLVFRSFFHHISIFFSYLVREILLWSQYSLLRTDCNIWRVTYVLIPVRKENALIKWGTNGCVEPSQTTDLCQRTGNCALTCWWNNSGQVTVRPAGRGNERRNKYGLLFNKHFKSNDILYLETRKDDWNSVTMFMITPNAVMALFLKMSVSAITDRCWAEMCAVSTRVSLFRGCATN